MHTTTGVLGVLPLTAVIIHVIPASTHDHHSEVDTIGQ